MIGSISEEPSRAWALTELAGVLGQAGRWSEAERVWQEAEQVIGSVSGKPSRAWALTKLAEALGQAGRWSEAERVWQEAEQVIGSISAWGQRGEALARLAEALGQAGRWSEAERMLGSISEKEQQGRALCNLADALAKHNEQERLLSLVHRWWLQAHTRDEAVKLLPLAFGFIPRYPNIGVAFHDAFAWVDDFLRG